MNGLVWWFMGMLVGLLVWFVVRWLLPIRADFRVEQVHNVVNSTAFVGDDEPLFKAIEITIQGDGISPAEPLWVQLRREDGSVQAELFIAAGYRLVVDADGVRGESYTENWLRQMRRKS